MAPPGDDELRKLQEEAERNQAGAGDLASQLAVTQTQAMGAGVAGRYAQMGARWLSDPVPTRLDSNLIERLSRHGFRAERLADVRIHRGLKAQEAADALGARAFAIGEEDIYFGRGEFDPSSRSGRAVLAHELAHVAPPGGASDAAPGGMGLGGIGAFNAPILNERRQGDDDPAREEAHERQARETEGRVFAMDDAADAPQVAMPAGPAPGGSQPAGPAQAIDPQVLEQKVLAIIGRFERGEIERAGRA